MQADKPDECEWYPRVIENIHTLPLLDSFGIYFVWFSAQPLQAAYLIVVVADSVSDRHRRQGAAAPACSPSGRFQWLAHHSRSDEPNREQVRFFRCAFRHAI